ncbi:MAG TPA: hypothetical protein VGG99_10250, partial [Acetobacteraceae bacterium]
GDLALHRQRQADVAPAGTGPIGRQSMIFSTKSARCHVARAIRVRLSDSDLKKLLQNPHLYLAYVLLEDNAHTPHIFLFRAAEFVDIVKRSDKRRNDKYCVCISMARESDKDWYVRRLSKFEDLSDTSVIDVSKHYGNFKVLEELNVQKFQAIP